MILKRHCFVNGENLKHYNANNLKDFDSLSFDFSDDGY